MPVQMLAPSTKIVIVGNGSGILNNRLRGLFIDSHDVVIRVGEFQIRPFETFVGTKTTMWAAGDLLQHPNKPQCDRWDQKFLDAVDVHRFPSTGPTFIKLLPEKVQAGNVFKALMTCVTRWPELVITITGHGPGLYWDKEQTGMGGMGESNNLQAELLAISVLERHGRVQVHA